MIDRYEAEARRLGELLLSLANTKKRSIRSLEREMGVMNGLLQKALTGDGPLQMRHLLMTVDALGIPWAEFFQMAYPSRSFGAKGEEKDDESLKSAWGRLANPEGPPPSDSES